MKISREFIGDHTLNFHDLSDGFHADPLSGLKGLMLNIQLCAKKITVGSND